MDAGGWQETLGRAVDVANAAGLLISLRLAPLLIGVLLTLLAVWIVRRRFRRFRRRVASGAAGALKGAAKRGAQGAGVAADAAAAAANEAKTALQEHAIPAARAAIESARPQVQRAAHVAADAAKAGADQAGDMLAKAMPVAKAAAGAAYGVTKDTATALGIMAQVKSAELLDKARAAQKKREEG